MGRWNMGLRHLHNEYAMGVVMKKNILMSAMVAGAILISTAMPASAKLTPPNIGSGATVNPHPIINLPPSTSHSCVLPVDTNPLTLPEARDLASCVANAEAVYKHEKERIERFCSDEAVKKNLLTMNESYHNNNLSMCRMIWGGVPYPVITPKPPALVIPPVTHGPVG